MVTLATSDQSTMAEVDDGEWEKIRKHQLGEELAAPCVVYAFQAVVIRWRGADVEGAARIMFARMRPNDDEKLQRVG